MPRINNIFGLHGDFSWKEEYVAYIDILGYKELIALSKADPSLVNTIINIIDGTYIDSLEILNAFFSERSNGIRETFGRPLKYRAFSDCICFWSETIEGDEHIDETLYNFFIQLVFIQARFNCQGIFLNGCLSKGKHFAGENILFSEGLSNAFTITERINHNPAILIDDCIYNEIQELPVGRQRYFEEFIYTESDKRYINYLNAICKIHNYDNLRNITLDAIREIIADRIEEYQGSIQAKYLWLKRYFNHTIQENDLDRTLIIQ